MDNTNQDCHHESKGSTKGPSKWYKVGTYAVLGIISYFLFTEHRAHVVPFLPYIFLLSCPLMHIFMHHGHGHHHKHGHDGEESSEKKEIK